MTDNKSSDNNPKQLDVVEFEPIEATGQPQITVSDFHQLPIMPVRNAVLFPGVAIPIRVSRPKTKRLVEFMQKTGKVIGVVMQKRADTEEPSLEDLCKYGTAASLVQVANLDDSTNVVVLQGVFRFELLSIDEIDPFLAGRIKVTEETTPPEIEFKALADSVREIAFKIINSRMQLQNELKTALNNTKDYRHLINLVISSSNIEPNEKQKLLDISNYKERGLALITKLGEEIHLIEFKNDIQEKVRSNFQNQQREFFLNQQIKFLQDELGGNPTEKEAEDMRERAKNKMWSKEMASFFEKELTRLNRLHPMSPDYSVQVNYLTILLDLPWDYCSTDDLDIKNAERVLNEDHYGLEKVKDRILEYLAVLKLKGDMKSPIICLYGPPGVGKTSLGKSIARALNRKYVRMSLGGLHDESEIRGHRRTYIGSMPGRVIQNIKKAGTSNPVFVLDEVDKLTKSAHGDPESALLEVLDPEQNTTFHDNFIDVDYDLSKVLFVATANVINNIHPALLDRMELIEVSGYLLEEKIEIALHHLIPKQMDNHGVKKSDINFSREVLTYIIEHYTQESGVRTLDKTIARIIRQIALRITTSEKYNIEINIDDVTTYLGQPKYHPEKDINNTQYGIATGLAWTATGGQILFIESAMSKGDGKLTTTGNLGNVMKESAILALEYIKSRTEQLKVDIETVEKSNFHTHVPEGAIPKDGPSAGITIVTSLVSAITKRKVKSNFAMTGEITLRGKVLQVGGIKEKILAAKRAGITDIILSEDNKSDISEFKPEYVENLTFHYVKNIDDVIELVISD